MSISFVVLSQYFTLVHCCIEFGHPAYAAARSWVLILGSLEKLLRGEQRLEMTSFGNSYAVWDDAPAPNAAPENERRIYIGRAELRRVDPAGMENAASKQCRNSTLMAIR